jgi:hypothetical protein
MALERKVPDRVPVTEVGGSGGKLLRGGIKKACLEMSIQDRI